MMEGAPSRGAAPRTPQVAGNMVAVRSKLLALQEVRALSCPCACI
jgi:hypothetical protein